MLSPDTSLLVDDGGDFLLLGCLPGISLIGENEGNLVLFVFFPLGDLYFEYLDYLLLLGLLPVRMLHSQPVVIALL